MTTKRPTPVLFLSDARGRYIPRDFAEEILPECLLNVDPEDLAILSEGPEHEWYWEAWENVERDAIVQDPDGTRYRIYMDGDCWLIPVGMEWVDAEEFFAWPPTDDVSEEA
jgi:hypothetical protein